MIRGNVYPSYARLFTPVAVLVRAVELKQYGQKAQRHRSEDEAHRAEHRDAPRTVRSTRKGWSGTPRLMRYGPSTLSIMPTASVPQIASPIAVPYAPSRIKNTIAGRKTISVPTPGISEPTPATAPHKTG